MLALAAWSCHREEGAVFRSWAGTNRCAPRARDVVGETNLLVSKSIAVSASEGTESPGDQSSLMNWRRADASHGQKERKRADLELFLNRYLLSRSWETNDWLVTVENHLFLSPQPELSASHPPPPCSASCGFDSFPCIQAAISQNLPLCPPGLGVIIIVPPVFYGVLWAVMLICLPEPGSHHVAQAS